MTRQCKFMPEIHEKVLSLISRMNTLHAQGQGSVQLTELVDLFGVSLKDSDRAKLQERAAINFNKTSDNGGTFENDGAPVSFSHEMITFTVPTQVSGTYLSFADSFTILFSEDHTISGGALFFKAKLEEFDANHNKVDIDLSGDAFDQCIIHSS